MRKGLSRQICGTILAATAGLAGPVGATTVTPGSLISLQNAQQLEAWLGIGAQDFTRIWTGVAGVAKAADFHAAVDGKGPTFSVFQIRLADASTALIGGYTTLDWTAGANDTYHADAAAFLFNLTTLERQTRQVHPDYAILHGPDSFATFGAGPDIFVGSGTLGTCETAVTVECDGRSYSYSYDTSQGQITVAADSGAAAGDSGIPYSAWSILSADTYTFAPMAVVPLPGGLPLLAGGMAALALMGRRARGLCSGRG